MKRSVASAASVLALVTASLATVASAPATAACAEETMYVTRALGSQYKPTRMRSDWANGGQRVTVAKGKTAANGVTTIKSGTHNINVGAEYGPIKASYNYTHSSTKKIRTSTSITLQESYSVRIPNGKQARQMRWARKMKVRVTKKRLQRSCDVVVVGRALILAPMMDRTFVWDFQDESGLPGCRVKGYPSYGNC